MKKKWNRKAMRFASARYIARKAMLNVTFEDGDQFLVSAESVLSRTNNGSFKRPGSRNGSRIARPTSADWTQLRINENGDVLEVPGTNEMIEIPWDRIRWIADPDFRAHLARQAAKRARRIGSRIRAMRLSAGLTRAALGHKVDVPRETIAKLETGKIEPLTELIEHIASALGRRLQDYSEDKKVASPVKRQGSRK
jgi:DNA-binding XRE family transcriptional regulator